jgi:mycofactocin glycosyltransferase
VGTFGRSATEAGPVRRVPVRQPFPAGFGLAADADLRIVAGGRVLIGGSPTRLIRLRPRAAAMTAGWLRGDPVADRRADRGVARRLVSAGVLHPRPTAGAPDMPVSAVVPVRDRPEALSRLLGSLRALPCVVVDDCSTDGLEIEKVARDAGAEYVRLAHHSGAAAARNAGLSKVRSPLVAFVDSDVVVPEGWLDNLVGHFGDPKVAMVAPRIVVNDGPGVLQRYEAVRSPLDLGEREGRVAPATRVAYVPSAAVVLRRAAASSRCFDERLATGEDVDLVWRLVAAGWDVRYVPSVRVVHSPEIRPIPWLVRRAAYGSSAGPLALRHGDAVAPARVTPAVAATWALVAAGHPLAAATVAATSTARLASRLTGIVDDPVAAALRLSVEGTARSVAPTVAGLTRVWGPLLVLALSLRRVGRARALAAGTLAIGAARGLRSRPDGMGPLTYAGLRLADDLSYGTGVWWGCWRARTLRPLVPAVITARRRRARPAVRALS